MVGKRLGFFDGLVIGFAVDDDDFEVTKGLVSEIAKQGWEIFLLVNSRNNDGKKG